MLARCQGMFAASLQQMHAARNELRNLQRFVRFQASGEDVAWAASGERQLCIQSQYKKIFMHNSDYGMIRTDSQTHDRIVLFSIMLLRQIVLVLECRSQQ